MEKKVPRYEWWQISQWESMKPDQCRKDIYIKTGLSQENITYKLVKIVSDVGGHKKSEDVFDYDVDQRLVEAMID